MSAFPIRVVYRLVEPQPNAAQIQMLVSVPKKHFKRAVKRNRVKRQIREAYRKHKHVLWDKASEGDKEEGTTALTYTVFDAKPSKKIGEGCMIRLAK